METIFFIEIITLFGVFIILALFWLITDISNTIKKNKEEKAKKNHNSLDRF